MYFHTFLSLKKWSFKTVILKCRCILELNFQWSLKNDHQKITFFRVYAIIFSLVLKKCHFDIKVYLSLSCPGKKVFLLSRFNLCKTYVKGSYFSKVPGFFLATFVKINTATVIFQGLSLDFKHFSLVYNTYTEDFPMPDSENFKISFQ